MNRRGMNFFEFLTAVFTVLKITHLTNVANWSWFWVLFPMLLFLVYATMRWIWEAMSISKFLRRDFQTAYLDHRKKQAMKETLLKDKKGNGR